MKLKCLHLILTVCSILLLIGCTNKSDIENTDEQERFEQVREVAWEFVEEKGWNDTAKEDWQSAKVKKAIANNNYELFDKTYEGKEALSVSFKDKDNVAVSTPSILVDPVTNKVIGYMIGE